MIGDGICDCSGEVGDDEMYRGSTEPVLDSLSDSYSDENRIFLGR